MERHEILLTPHQAYQAMELFVEGYFERGLRVDEQIGLFLWTYVGLTGLERTTDPATWSDWMACVHKVISQLGDSIDARK